MAFFAKLGKNIYIYIYYIYLNSIFTHFKRVCCIHLNPCIYIYYVSFYISTYLYIYIYVISICTQISAEREKHHRLARVIYMGEHWKRLAQPSVLSVLYAYNSPCHCVVLIAMVHTISDIKLKIAKCDVAVTVKKDKILFTFKGTNVNPDALGKETNDSLGKEARSNLPKKLSEMSLMQLASVPAKIVQPNYSKKRPPLSNRQIMHGWWRY